MRKNWVVLFLFGVIGGVLILWIIHFSIFNNFYEVDKNKVYRSAQMNASDLIKTIQHYKIKSVLNLRGDSSHRQWYIDELNSCRLLGVSHYDITMNASEFPAKRTLNKINTVLNIAKYPLLIHCNRGADRTGLVCAIYLREFKKVSNKTAKEQLSILFGHIPLFGYEKWINIICRSIAINSVLFMTFETFYTY